jgi:hypothetical protein
MSFYSFGISRGRGRRHELLQHLVGVRCGRPELERGRGRRARAPRSASGPLLARPAPESGTLCHGDGPRMGRPLQKVFVLPILIDGSTIIYL